MVAAKRYPANDITPHGWWHMLNGQPMVRLTAWDGSVEFYLLGPNSIPDRYLAPECVKVQRNGMTGLIPPWKHVQQKGATQDGITHLDALLDPIEIGLKLSCYGRKGKHLREVVRDLIASIDAKKVARLDFWSPEAGWWWSDVRWFQGAPPDPEIMDRQRRHDISLRLQADDGLWTSEDYTNSFSFDYTSMLDEFDTDYSPGAGPNWPLRYDEAGGGYVYTHNGEFHWHDDPDDWLLTQSREVVCGPYKDFSTDTDNQVVSIVPSWFQEWSLPAGAGNDIWARMGRDVSGNWDGNGVRVRFENNTCRLVKYIDFVPTQMKQELFLIPILPNETFTLVAGYEGNARLFKVLRNGLTMLAHVETGSNLSRIGSAYRGVGFGVQAGAALITQATPAPLHRVFAGDNSTVAQDGFIEMVNVGDQSMYWDATLFGPGTFRIWNGPGAAANEFIELGPILDNQIVFLRTDPRSNTTLVQDLSVVPPSPQDLAWYQVAVERLISFFTARNAFTAQIESAFGIRTPQGPLYKYLNGRFSDDAAIPPKSPGKRAESYYIKVQIDDGTADSKIVLCGTPKRRYPL